ncbi:MAG: hypothetical protein JW797_16125 [Bradymonadales bacterium]|nr:hypothetical protein [Bradymonadales bacterium]
MFEDPHQAQETLHQVLRASQADETQVSVGGGRYRALRFGNEQILLTIEERLWHIQVQVAYRRMGRWDVGRAQGTDLSAEGIERLLVAARDCANLSGPDPDYIELPYPGEFESHLPDVSLAHDQRTARVGPAFCANEVASVILPCHRLELRCGGHYSVQVGSLDRLSNPGLVAVANSNGLFQHFYPTRAEIAAWILSPTSGVATFQQIGHQVAQLDINALVEQAIRRAQLPLSATGPSPSNRPVLLEPAAMAAILELIAPHFTHASYSSGRGFLADKLGETLFSPSLTVAIHPTHPLLLERPFDGEGWPRRHITLIDQGTIAGLVYTRQQARRQRVSPSGYTPVSPDLASPSPEHLVMNGQEGSVEDLVGTMDHGLIISRLANLRWIDESSWLAAATTDLGLVRVNRGQMISVAPDQEIRFSIPDLLERLDRIGEAIRVGESVAPPVIGSL